MQKLPEASDRKRGDACARKRDRLDKKEETLSFYLFQQRPAECQHLANWWRTPCVRLLDDPLANPSTGSCRHLSLPTHD